MKCQYSVGIVHISHSLVCFVPTLFTRTMSTQALIGTRDERSAVRSLWLGTTLDAPSVYFFSEFCSIEIGTVQTDQTEFQ